MPCFKVQISKSELNSMKENAECQDMSDVEFIEATISRTTDSHGRPLEFHVNVQEITDQSMSLEEFRNLPSQAEITKQLEKFLEKYRAYLEHTISPAQDKYEDEIERPINNARNIILNAQQNVQDALLEHTNDWDKDDCILLSSILDFIDTLNDGGE